MINYFCNNQVFISELMDVIKLFEPFVKKNVQIVQNLQFENVYISSVKIENKEYFYYKKAESLTRLKVDNLSEIERKRVEKRFSKNALYFALSNFFKHKMPWGSLTGVKPVKLIKSLIEKEGFIEAEIGEFLTNEMFVSKNKVELALAILNNQPKVISNSKNICVYVNIPFCPERCSYCSFVSKVSADQKVLDEYVSAVVDEIEKSKNLLKNKTITSIYFGGGTPSILSTEQIKRILAALKGFKTQEFVFECGRADTLAMEKLTLLKQFGVTRICVNPQTFNKKVLNKINRHISNEQVADAIDKAKKQFIVNSDLIAGLPGESFLSFKKSVKILSGLGVDNISVHSLAIKRTSMLEQQNVRSQKTCKKMLEFAINYLLKNGYKPYYLYRLKNTFEGLENIGFCKGNTACLFNICSMDERQSIVAFGANAISKKIDFDKNYIDRVENPKDIETYVKNLDSYIERKIKFFIK